MSEVNSPSYHNTTTTTTTTTSGSHNGNSHDNETNNNSIGYGNTSLNISNTMLSATLSPSSPSQSQSQSQSHSSSSPSPARLETSSLFGSESHLRKTTSTDSGIKKKSGFLSKMKKKLKGTSSSSSSSSKNKDEDYRLGSSSSSPASYSTSNSRPNSTYGVNEGDDEDNNQNNSGDDEENNIDDDDEQQQQIPQQQQQQQHHYHHHQDNESVEINSLHNNNNNTDRAYLSGKPVFNKQISFDTYASETELAEMDPSSSSPTSKTRAISSRKKKDETNTSSQTDRNSTLSTLSTLSSSLQTPEIAINSSSLTTSSSSHNFGPANLLGKLFRTSSHIPIGEEGGLDANKKATLKAPSRSSSPVPENNNNNNNSSTDRCEHNFKNPFITRGLVQNEINPMDIEYSSVEILLIEGRNLAVRDRNGFSDPYCKFRLGKANYKSRTIFKNLNPRWDEKIILPVESILTPLHISVFDFDYAGGDDPLGIAVVDLAQLVGLQEPKTLVLQLEDIESGELVLKMNLVAKTDTVTTLKRKKRIKLKKSHLKSGTLEVTLIEGRDIFLRGDTVCDPIVKFKLGNQKYKSKFMHKTSEPKWLEQFELYATDEGQTLQLAVFHNSFTGKDLLIGNCDVPLDSLAHGRTEDIWTKLQNTDMGEIHLLLTIVWDKDEPDSILANRTMWQDMSHKKIVGCLTVDVLKAEGLSAADVGGTSDPFVVLELGNQRLKTNTIQKTLNPVWNRSFIFDVRDVHSVLSVIVYDEDKGGKSDFLGKIIIPLLNIQNGPKKYVLKDEELMRRAKGTITLQMHLDFHLVKACLQTIQPKELRYLDKDEKFRPKLLMRNVNRVKRVFVSIISFFAFIKSIFEWENKVQSSIAFAGYIYLCFYMQLWMIPFFFVCIFLYQNLLRKLRGTNSAAVENLLDFGSDGEEEDDDDVSGNGASTTSGSTRKKDSSKTGLRDRIKAIEKITQNIQNILGSVASFGERVKNLFNWTVPFASTLVTVVLIIVTIVLYYVPIRYILLLAGINKFTKKFRMRPGHVSNNEVADLLSRLPSDVELVERLELKP